MKKLHLSSARQRKVLDSLGRRVVSKLLSKPTLFVRNQNTALEELERLRILQAVFDLGEDGN